MIAVHALVSTAVYTLHGWYPRGFNQRGHRARTRLPLAWHPLIYTYIYMYIPYSYWLPCGDGVNDAGV